MLGAEGALGRALVVDPKFPLALISLLRRDSFRTVGALQMVLRDRTWKASLEQFVLLCFVL